MPNYRSGFLTPNTQQPIGNYGQQQQRPGLLGRIGRTLGNLNTGIGNMLSAAGNVYAPPDMNLSQQQKIGLLGSVLGDMSVGPRGERSNNTPDFLNNIRATNELARQRQVMNSPQIQGLLSNVGDPALNALLQEQVASGDVTGGLNNLFNYNRAEEAKRSMIDAARLQGIDPATLQALEGMDAAGIQEYLDDLQTRVAAGLQRRFTMGSDIKDDFTAATEGFRERADKYQQIQAFADDPSAAGDIAMVFAYMKLLDPGSVVRESEYATAQQAGSIIDRATVGQYNRLIAGERLTPTQRADFANKSKVLYEQALSGYENILASETQRATNFGLEFDRDVIPGLELAVSRADLDLIEEYTEEDFDVPELSEEQITLQAKTMVDRQTGRARSVQEAIDSGDDLALVELGFNRQEATEFLEIYFTNARLAYPDMTFE